jgi:uncharacterized protein (UPF0333 family)
MGNQKYIISSLLIIIIILLGFATYLLFQKQENVQTTTKNIKTTITNANNKTNENISKNILINNNPKKYKETLKDIKLPEITKRSPGQPEVYLGYKVSIPKNIGCIKVGQYNDDKKPRQDELRNSLTKEIKETLNGYLLNGWVFQQACKADDYTIAYSLYNKDRSDKYLSNNMLVAFVEDKLSFNYFRDERINKPKNGSEICNIYKLTTTFLEFSCNTNDGIKKWQLPFNQDKRITPLN